MSGFAVIVVLIPLVGLVLLLANALLETSQMDAEKSTTYECGFTPLQGLTRLPLALAFYLVGLLFLVFDLELLLLIPLSVTWVSGGPFPIVVFVGLLGILAAGIWYEINEGALDFASENQTQPLLTAILWPHKHSLWGYTKRKLISSYVSLAVAQLIGYARDRYMHASTTLYGSSLGRVPPRVRDDSCYFLSLGREPLLSV